MSTCTLYLLFTSALVMGMESHDGHAERDGLRLVIGPPMVARNRVDFTVHLLNVSDEERTLRKARCSDRTWVRESYVIFRNGKLFKTGDLLLPLEHVFEEAQDRVILKPGELARNVIAIVGLEPGSYDLTGLVGYDVHSFFDGWHRATFALPQVSFVVADTETQSDK